MSVVKTGMSQRDTAGAFSSDIQPSEREAWNVLPAWLDIEPAGRWPVRLKEETEQLVLERPLPPSIPEQMAVGVQWPQVTIVVPGYNNLVFTRMCLESILGNTTDIDFELVVVDNGSTDGTRCYLYALARRDARVRPLFNPTNLGFAAAVNQGLDSARGDYLVILNNDTLVPPEAISSLVQHLDDPGIGLVGPVTNRIANEAQISTSYKTYGQMLQFAASHCPQYRGQSSDLHTNIMFCVAFRRALYEAVGSLDEGYGIGLFEDEDYSRRVQNLGLRLVCAEDAFVHHFGEATTGALGEDESYSELFRANCRRYENKWGVDWIPHQHRTTIGHQNSVQEFRRAVKACTPDSARVLVVSRGDSDLLKLGRRPAFHFPCSEDGSFLGYYPASSPDAIELLELMRSRGAEFIAFPDSSRWWLDHYQGFLRHLERTCRLHYQDSPAVIFDLRDGDSAKTNPVMAEPGTSIAGGPPEGQL